MIKYVLTVAGPEMQTSEQLYKLGMHAVHSCLKQRSFALLLYGAIDLGSCLFNRFLYPCRMYASVNYQLFESNARNFAAYGIKA